MADLILAPMLRYVDETSGTIWVETDGACEVEVLGRRERTFCAEGTIVDDKEWEWITEHADGDFDHYIFADNRSIRTSLERRLA